MTDGFEGSLLTHGTFESVIPGKTIVVKAIGKIRARLTNTVDDAQTSATIHAESQSPSGRGQGGAPAGPSDIEQLGGHCYETSKDLESLPPVIKYAEVHQTGPPTDDPD
jgi:hypothetical protein